jgi:hypothetical protein
VVNIELASLKCSVGKAMSVPLIAFSVGLALIVVSILGGGIEVKEIKIPSLPLVPRLLCFVFGSALLGIFIFKPELLQSDEHIRKPDLPTRLPDSGRSTVHDSSQNEPRPPPGRSVWLVDKSYVYLEATGDKRQFFFLKPTAESLAQGAQPGLMLFNGRIIGETSYEGKLFVFAGRKCGTWEYGASGPISAGPTVTLTGWAPQVDTDTCQKIGEQDRTLIFNYKYKD